MALTDSLDELITSGAITPQLAMKVLQQVDMQPLVASAVADKYAVRQVSGRHDGEAGQNEDNSEGESIYNSCVAGSSRSGRDKGTSAHVPPVRRCVDVHREESRLQDGGKRDSYSPENQDRCMQEWRRDRDRKEVMTNFEWLSIPLPCRVIFPFYTETCTVPPCTTHLQLCFHRRMYL